MLKGARDILIEVENLRKVYKIADRKDGLRGAISNLFVPKFKEKVAVDGVSFSIKSGDMVAYIGTNGAGKSTTIKMLTGILSPTSGKILINGENPNKNKIKRNQKIGALFGQRSLLWWDLPVIESLRLLKVMYEIPEDTYKNNISEFTELLDLELLLRTPVRQLSLGQKMRCEIAAAFLHNPEIIYMDEPTIGLDIMVKEKIRAFIVEMNRQHNTTILLTTHDLDDVEEICNRAIIIDKGKLIHDGTLKEIMNKSGQYRVVNFKVKKINDDSMGILGKFNADFHLSINDAHEISVKITNKEKTVLDVMEFVSTFCEVQDLSIEDPTIESVIKQIYQGEQA